MHHYIANTHSLEVEYDYCMCLSMYVCSGRQLPSTGNAQADADIATFYHFRDKLKKKQTAGRHQAF